MVTVDRKVLEQALEFVTSKQWGTTPYMDARVYEDAARLRDTLQAALAQPEQEPVAWMRPDETLCVVREVAEDEGYQPLYTHPPRREWCSLSEEEIESLECDLSADRAYENYTGQEYLVVNGASDFARAIEAALKAKNT